MPLLLLPGTLAVAFPPRLALTVLSCCPYCLQLMADSQRKMDEELAAQAASPRGTSLLTVAEQKQKSRAKGSGGGPHSLKAGLCGLRGKLVEQETQLAAEQRRRLGPAQAGPGACCAQCSHGFTAESQCT